MKKFIFLILIILLNSCAKKGTAKSSFKLVVGSQALATPMNGGVFLETHELSLDDKKIFKLDAENSATFPTGTYNLLIVAFSGPSEKSGSMYCGSAENAALLSASSSITITINQTNCNDAKYMDFISKLSGSSNWDAAKFDQGKWGP